MGATGTDAIRGLGDFRLPMVLAMLAEIQQVANCVCRDLQNALQPQTDRRSSVIHPPFNIVIGDQKCFHSESKSVVADEDLPTYANALDGRENAAKKLEEAVARVHSVLCLSLEAVVGNVTAEISRERRSNAGLLQKISRLEGDIKNQARHQADQIEELQQDLERTREELYEATGLQKQLRNKDEEIAALRDELLKLNTQFTQTLKGSPKSQEQVVLVEKEAGLSRSPSVASELEAELERVNMQLRRFQTQSHQKDEVIEGLREALREMSLKCDAPIGKVTSSPCNAKPASSDFRGADPAANLQWNPVESARVSKRLRKGHGFVRLSGGSQQNAVLTSSLADELQDEKGKDKEDLGLIDRQHLKGALEFASAEEAVEHLTSIKAEAGAGELQRLDWNGAVGKLGIMGNRLGAECAAQEHSPVIHLRQALQETQMCLQETEQREKECFRKTAGLELACETLQRKLAAVTGGMAASEEDRDRLRHRNGQLRLEIEMLRSELQRLQHTVRLVGNQEVERSCRPPALELDHCGADGSLQNGFRGAADSYRAENTEYFSAPCSPAEHRLKDTPQQTASRSSSSPKIAESVFPRQGGERGRRCYSDLCNGGSFRHMQFFVKNNRRHPYIICDILDGLVKSRAQVSALKSEQVRQIESQPDVHTGGSTVPNGESKENSDNRIQTLTECTKHDTALQGQVTTQSSDSKGDRHVSHTAHLEHALALRTSQVQCMLELNEALSLENEEIRTRFLDILKKEREEAALAYLFLQKNSGSSDGDGKKREHFGLKALSPHEARELEKYGGNLGSAVSSKPTPRCSHKRRPLARVPMYRPVALPVRDLAPKSHQYAPNGSGDIKHDIFGRLRDQLASVRKFGVQLLRGRDDEAESERRIHVSISSSVDTSERHLSPQRVAPSGEALSRRKDSAWKVAQSDSSRTFVDGVASSESLGMQLSGHEKAATVESLSTTESHTGAIAPSEDASAMQQCSSTAVLPATARSFREREKMRRPAALDMYTDVESRRFHAYI